MNKIALFTLVSSLTLLSCSTSKSGIILKDLDNKDELSLTLKTSDTLRITMEGNVTTGYNWYYNEIPENATVKIVKDTYEERGEKKPEGWVGAPSTKVYDIVAPQTGKYTLKFEYKRGWETNAPAKLKTINLNVVKP